MLAEEIPYDTYLDGDFAQISHVRAFGPWQVLAAAHGEASLLLLVNDEAHSVTRCLYESRDARDWDAMWVRKLSPDDGGAAAGVLARLRPPPPTRLRGEAKALPESDDAPD